MKKILFIFLLLLFATPVSASNDFRLNEWQLVGTTLQPASSDWDVSITGDLTVGGTLTSTYLTISQNVSSPFNIGDGNNNATSTLTVLANGNLEIKSTSTAPIMVLTNRGNVGIGTTSPVAKLNLSGGRLRIDGIELWEQQDHASFNAVGFQTVADNQGTSFRMMPKGTASGVPGGIIQMFGTDFVADGTNYNWIEFAMDNGNNEGRLKISKAGTATQQPFNFYVGSTNVMTLATTGNVGIGTTTPLSLLHIAGGVSATTTVEFAPRSTSAKTCFNVRNTTGAATSFYFVGTTMKIEANLCK